MIVSVGMVFDMVSGGPEKRQTPITDFYDFVESGQFCKAHIMARPNRRAYFHHQHMNLNLKCGKISVLLICLVDMMLLNGP